MSASPVVSKFLQKNDPKTNADIGAEFDNSSGVARYLSTRAPHNFEGTVHSYAIKPSANPKKKGTEYLILEIKVTSVECGAASEKGGPDMPLQPGQIVTHMVTLDNRSDMYVARALQEMGLIAAAISGQEEAPFLDKNTATSAIAEVFSSSDHVGRKIIALGTTGRPVGDKVYYNTRFMAG